MLSEQWTSENDLFFVDLDQNLPLSNSDAYNLLGTLFMMRMEWNKQVIYFLRLAYNNKTENWWYVIYEDGQ